MNIGIIGAGTTGTALAVRLSQSGYTIASASSRSFSSAERLAHCIKGSHAYTTAQEVADTCQLVFITTPDDAIAVVAAQVQWCTDHYVVHCSGAQSVDILSSAKANGAHTGSFHPLQTFASIEHAIDNLPGSTFSIETEEPLLSLLKDMAVRLEGNWIVLKAGDKVLYHAAAVFASNYFVTLMKLSTDLWQTFGIPQSQASKALLPLIQGTLQNFKNVGLPNCLTGPIARGDIGTVKAHLKALQEQAPAVLSTYKEMGRQTIPVALAKGKINTDQARELQNLLN